MEFDLEKKLPAYPVVQEEDIRMYLAILSLKGQKRYAAMQVGIEPCHLRNMVKADESLAAREVDALDGYNELLEMEMHRRGVEGTDKGVYFKGDKVDTEKVYSDRLLEMLVKANNPGKFRDHVTVDANVKAGVLVVSAALDVDDWEQSYGKMRIDTSRLDDLGVQSNQSPECPEGGGGT